MDLYQKIGDALFLDLPADERRKLGKAEVHARCYGGSMFGGTQVAYPTGQGIMGMSGHSPRMAPVQLERRMAHTPSPDTQWRVGILSQPKVGMFRKELDGLLHNVSLNEAVFIALTMATGAIAEANVSDAPISWDQLHIQIHEYHSADSGTHAAMVRLVWMAGDPGMASDWAARIVPYLPPGHPAQPRV